MPTRNSVETQPSSKVAEPKSVTEAAKLLAYLDRLKLGETSILQSPEYSASERLELLWFDTFHLIQELILSRIVTRFSYDLETTKGLTGEGYLESLDAMHANFVRLFQVEGLTASRGTTEFLVFERLKHQLLALAKQYPQPEMLNRFCLVVTSPPDDQPSGYHGIDSKYAWQSPESHHSFIYVYQIENVQQALIETNETDRTQASVAVTQYRTWHNMDGLLKLHQDLGAGFSPTDTIPITNQLLANVIAMEFQPSDSAASIDAYFRQKLYQDQHHWLFKTDDVPQLDDRTSFETECRVLFDNFFGPRVLELYQQLTPETMTQPELVAHITKQINLLTSHFFAAIQNRVRQLNQNPVYEHNVKKQLLKEMVKKPWLAPQLIKQYRLHGADRTLPERLPIIQQLYSLDEGQTLFGEKLNPDQHRWYMQHASQTLSFANFIFGSAQCAVLTPFTAPISILKEATKLGSLEKIGGAIGNLPITTKIELFDLLTTQEYVELQLPGAKQIWMVPKSYLEAPGCRVDAEGRVIGPCDIYLDDPAETLALPMDQTAFDQYLAQMSLQLHQSELNQIEQTILTTETSPAQQQKARQLFLKLKQLIIKPSINVQDLLNNNLLNPTVGHHRYLQQVIEQLKHAANPVVTLNQIVNHLLTQSATANPAEIAAVKV